MADGYKGTAYYRKSYEDWLKAQKPTRAKYDAIQMESLKHDAAMKDKYRKAGAKYSQAHLDSLKHDAAMKAKYRKAGEKYK